MKRRITITILVALMRFVCFGQEKYVDDKCIRNNNLKAIERGKNYPFNKTAYIKLASFENWVPEDENTMVSVFDIPTINGKVDIEKLKEIKVASSKDIERLTDIIYNHGFKKGIITIDAVNCFTPRNAILFFDKNNNLIEYLEVCFECKGFGYGYSKVELGDNCDGKIDMVKELFLSNGIKYGVTEK